MPRKPKKPQFDIAVSVSWSATGFEARATYMGGGAKPAGKVPSACQAAFCAALNAAVVAWAQGLYSKPDSPFLAGPFTWTQPPFDYACGANTVKSAPLKWTAGFMNYTAGSSISVIVSDLQAAA
jgi:hypothetical protein